MKLVPEELDHAELRSIALDAQGPTLAVEYGIPDQGGALLLYRFRIPSGSNGHATLDCRYLHDPPPRPSEQPSPVASSELPSRLRRDVSKWLSEQEALASKSNREPLSAALRRLRAAIQ
jgi:hypothetical protein